MKNTIQALLALMLLGTATASQAFWGGNNWGNNWNPYDEWDPRYWMEEMENIFDDDYGPGYGYGGPYGYGPGPGYYGGGPYGPAPYGYGGPAPYGYGAPPPYYGPQQYAPRQYAPPPRPAPAPAR